MAKIIIGLIVTIVVIIIGNLILPVPQVAIEVAAEPIGLGPLTNALFTSIILSIIMLVFAFVVGSNLKEKPGGLQNIFELLIEALDGLVTSIAPKKWAPTFFPILATIFIYLLFANWISLLTPLLGSFGIVHSTDSGGIPIEQVTFITGGPDTLTPVHHGGEEAAEGGAEVEHGGDQALIVPFFRAPSSDLNLTFALALMTMVLVQVFGVWERGIGYFGNFIRLKGFSEQGIGMGAIDFFVGLLEGVSEIAKIISFSFRLFGNIFAGEVVLIVIISLVSLLLILVFFGLEIFVGFIQAFVFFILSLVFYSIAVQEHGEGH
jgi:F-type H+-transporting ATPase subunit a